LALAQPDPRYRTLRPIAGFIVPVILPARITL
jgi:hypothetical protein